MDQARSFPIAADDISPDFDPLILVDEADRVVGHMSKTRCHQGGGDPASGLLAADLQ